MRWRRCCVCRLCGSTIESRLVRQGYAFQQVEGAALDERLGGALTEELWRFVLGRFARDFDGLFAIGREYLRVQTDALSKGV